MAVASSAPAPFAIHVSDTDLADLAERLRRTRFSPSVATQPWVAGVDETVLRPLVDHWRDGSDWRERERALGEVPQFRADIGGQRVHFTHLRADSVAAAPVVLTHGWPYSFVEMLRLARRLAEPRRFGIEGPAFDVVVPSLPGYAFSDPFATPPFTARRVADLWRSLMVDTLGYERFLTYGEDVGTGVSDTLASAYPESVMGLLATHAAFPPASRSIDPTPEESAFQNRLGGEWADERGYSEQQRTKPDTLAAALVDSPAGLVAWLVEKFRTWSGGPDAYEAAWSRDDVLTTVSLYWFSRCIGTSFAAYWSEDEDLDVVDVPVVVAVQRGERGFPRSFAARTYRDIRAFSELPEGGHFTAFQSPDLVAAELRRLLSLL
jgi:pimeloyl-ACP methyl ester carboxylesterase